MCGASGSTDARPLFQRDGYAFLICTACDSAHLLPPPADTAELYDAAYFTGGAGTGDYSDYARDEHLQRRNARDRLDRIHSAGAEPPGSLIELGGGYGYFLD